MTHCADRLLTLLLFTTAACTTNAAPPAPLAPAGAPAAPAAIAAASHREVTFTGMCDASGAVALDEHHFVVADDEDNVLRIYDARAGGAPLHAHDMSPDLPLRKAKADKGKKKDKKQHKDKGPGKSPESDLEAAASVGGEAYWLASHALTKTGKAVPARFVFFATSLPPVGKPITLVGKAYTQLLEDLLAAPSLSSFGLDKAAERRPKDEGGLNIEGMTALLKAPGVLLGFRNPVPQGRALLVPLQNPLAVMQGERAKLGEPRQLDLGGLGVRSLSSWRGRYLIAAGHYAGGSPGRLFSWDGVSNKPQDLQVALSDFNLEGFFTPEQGEEILLLSDDGEREVKGERCKDLESQDDKLFRGRWLRAPRALGQTPPQGGHPGGLGAGRQERPEGSSS